MMRMKQHRERAATFVDSLLQDIKYAARASARHRAFAAVALLTLSVGLGGAITAFVIADRVLIRPLPYPDGQALVSIIQAEERAGALPMSVLNFSRIRAGATSFASLGAAIPVEMNLHIGDELLPTQGAQVTHDFFPTLATALRLGRGITPNDTRRGAAPVVVIKEDLWRNQFGGDPTAIGRTVMLTGVPHTLVGVMPRTFDLPKGTQFWTACTWCDTPPAGSVATGQVFGRLRGASIDTVNAELDVLWRQIHDQLPPDPARVVGRAAAVPLRDTIVGEARGAIRMLGAGMAILLLIGCANLASATMARNVTRTRELALRAALGASRRRVVQQLAVESLVLSTIATAGGFAVATVLLRSIAHYGAAHFPRLSEVRVDAITVGFAMLLAVLVALMIGVLPALKVATRQLARQIAATSKGTGGTQGRGARVLIGAEVALCLLVVAAAGLALRSLQVVYRQPVGVETSGLATLKPQLDFRRYRTAQAQLDFYERAVEQISAIPGVQGAAVAATLPLGEPWVGLIEIEGQPELTRPISASNIVTHGYFAAVGVPLLRGRLLLPSDDRTTEHVTVINQAMADRYWRGQDPIGQRFRPVSFSRGPQGWLTIVGVVADVRPLSLETRYQPMHFVSPRQRPAMLGATTIVARSANGSAETLLPALRAALRTVDPDARGITGTVDQMLAETTLERRQTAAVLAGLAALALLLAGMGIYGVLAYSVAQRRQEIGIRMALGATASRVVRQTVGELWLPVLGGVVAGLASAKAASSVLSALVFGITPSDVPVMVLAAGALLLLAAAASFVPARRAVRVNPAVTLRGD